MKLNKSSYFRVKLKRIKFELYTEPNLDQTYLNTPLKSHVLNVILSVILNVILNAEINETWLKVIQYWFGVIVSGEKFSGGGGW